MLARRLAIAFGLAVVALAAAGIAGFLWLRSGGLPRRSGEAAIAGLSAPVSVRWGRRGVPYVEAASAEDLAAALGYLHANDRLTQLELGRRAAAGRLAELAGEAAVGLDRRFRILRLRPAAERLWASAGPETRQQLEAYARGVNARLAELAAGDRLPPDLRLAGGLGWEGPEPWQPVDSLCFVLLMANDLSFWQGRPEEERFLWLRALGEARTRDLLGEPDLVVPPEVAALAAAGAASGPEGSDQTAAEAASGAADAGSPGSNNWIVGASLTASGRPLVAGDPHLPMRLPAVWYQALLRAPDYEAAGMTLPGLPGVVIGRSAELAWGLTNVMLDDHDLFVEELSDDGSRVRRGDGWAPVEHRRETIRVRGGEAVDLELAATDLGQLLPADEARGLPPRSLAWTLYEPADPLSAFVTLGRAGTVGDALAGLSGFVGPAQNLVVADRDGDLAWTVLGRIPERGAGDGRLPSPGRNPAYRWLGLRDRAENPGLRRPADDLVVTANENLLPPGYPRPFAADYDTPHRARRIRQRLADGAGWTPAAAAALQADVVSLYAREVVALLGGGDSGGGSGDAGRARDLLVAWDGAMGPAIRGSGGSGGSGGEAAGRAATGPGAATVPADAAAALFTLVERALGEGIFGDEAAAHGLPPLDSPERLLRALGGEMDEAWFDDVTTPEREGRREVVERALERAWGEAVARWGESPAAWSYTAMHRLDLAHPLGGVPLLGRWFNRGPFAVSGSATTVNASGARWRGEGDSAVQAVTYGPSMRFATDLGDPDSTLTVLPGGQSGHPADPHYDDQLADYLAGRTHPFPWSDSAIAAATVGELWLVPARRRVTEGEIE